MTTTKVLFVDDDPNILEACQRNLRKVFPIDIALGGSQGLDQIAANGPYAVIVADMQMPHMNGIEFLKQAELKTPDTVRIMMTGNADQQTAVDAVNKGGVFRFLNKPCTTDGLVEALRAAQQQFQLILAERELLEKTLNGAVKILTDVLSAIDPRSFGRGCQLRELVQPFLWDLPAKTRWEIELAAMLSPIGRVTLPPTLLAKERSGQGLTPMEREMFQRVPEVGAELLCHIPRLENVAQLVRLQNKGFDGSGLPANGPRGFELPIGARLLKVLCDLIALEAVTGGREAALLKMQKEAARYDPEIFAKVKGDVDPVSLAPRAPILLPGMVLIEDLRAGNTLLRDIQTIEGMLVVTSGTVLSPMLVERLKNFHSLGSIGKAVLIRP